MYVRAALRHKRDLVLSFGIPLGALFLGVAVPFFAGKVLAGIVQQNQPLGELLALLAVFSLLGVVANRVGFKHNMSLQAKTMSDLNRMVFERLLHRSIGFHANRVSGKLVSDTIDFVGAFGQLSNTAFVNAFGFALIIVTGVVVVLVNSWQLGLFVAAIVAFTLGWALVDSRRRSMFKVKRLAATKRLTSHLSDSIVNAQTVKTFAQEKLEMQRNHKLNRDLENMRIHDWQRAGKSGNNRMTVLLATQFTMMLLIIHLTRANPELLATGIFAFTYTMLLTNRLFEINTLIRQMEEAMLMAAPTTSVLHEIVEIQDNPGAGELVANKGKIEMSGISFAYPDNAGNGAVFEQFNLTVQPGEKVGLVGPSGGGKSTLTRLLLRFDEAQAGTISIDGQDIACATQESLRRSIAYVPQEPLLFHRTIRENIAYGRPDASNKKITQAAERANAHDFIKALPEGYDTMVGERGVKLSGGQRQRIAIARAMLKDAPILILDEATSALDSENEAQVQDALWHLMQKRTTIVIAHRLSTIQKMDRIVVLNEGKVAEEGSHKQLLGKKGLYAKLWKHQSGGFIEE